MAICGAPNCGESVGESGNWASIIEAEVCEGCWGSDLEHGSTIIHFGIGGDVEKITLGDLSCITEYGDDADHRGFDRKYHSTDGWRGHYTTNLVGEWTEVAEDLLLWGQQTDGQTLAERVKAACEGGELPVGVSVVVDPTSNLFAQGISLWVKREDAPTFAEWVKA